MIDKWAAPKVWVLFSRFRWSPSFSRLEGYMRLFLGDFPSFMEQAKCVLFRSNPSGQVVCNCHLVLRGKKLASYVKDNLDPKFGSYMWQLMGLPSKIGNTNYCVSLTIFCKFWTFDMRKLAQKNYINWHAQFKIWHVVWLCEEKNHTLKNWNDTSF